MDNFTETSSQSWFSRIGSAFTGIIFGFILLLIAVGLLFWNESRSVLTAQSLSEGAKDVVVATADTVNPDFEQKMVYVSGDVKAGAPVADANFGVSANAIRLVRNVSMYQWKEEKSTQTNNNATGGGNTTTTTYTYRKEWSPGLIDSSNFKHPDDHANPAQMAVTGLTITARHVTLGAYDVPDSVISKMDGDQPLTLGSDALDKVSSEYKDKVQMNDGGFYLGKDPSVPAIGDEKITYTTLPAGPFSIVAEQTGKTFEPYTTRNGEEVILVESGNVTADQMFHRAESENSSLTWILRAVGALLMFFGVLLIVNPIAVLADIIPFLGGIVSFGIGLTAFGFSLILTLSVIALAWIAARPVTGIALLVIVVAGLVWLISSLHNHAGKSAAAR